MLKELIIFVLALTAASQVSFGQIDENADTTQTTIIKMYQDIEAFKRLKFAGYIQAQFQYADSSGPDPHQDARAGRCLGGDFGFRELLLAARTRQRGREPDCAGDFPGQCRDGGERARRSDGFDAWTGQAFYTGGN